MTRDLPRLTGLPTGPTVSSRAASAADVPLASIVVAATPLITIPPVDGDAAPAAELVPHDAAPADPAVALLAALRRDNAELRAQLDAVREERRRILADLNAAQAARDRLATELSETTSKLNTYRRLYNRQIYKLICAVDAARRHKRALEAREDDLAALRQAATGVTLSSWLKSH